MSLLKLLPTLVVFQLFFALTFSHAITPPAALPTKIVSERVKIQSNGNLTVGGLELFGKRESLHIDCDGVGVCE